MVRWTDRSGGIWVAVWVGIAVGVIGAAARGAAAPSGGDDDRPVVPVGPSTGPRLDPKLPTVFLVGDSTLNSPAPLRGWAQEIGAYFDPHKVNVANRGRGGRSARTYYTEGLWQKVVDDMKAGDVVLIQFGHNDAGRYDDPRAKGRPSLKGTGEETAEVTKPDGSKETVHTYGWYLRKYIADVKGKGATAVICSMVPHQDWRDGKVATPERETFVKWARGVAEDDGAKFLDLNQIIASKYNEMGEEKVRPMFADRRTHTSPAGAKVSAACVVAGLKGVMGDVVEGWMSEKGKGVAATQPAAAAGGR